MLAPDEEWRAIPGFEDYEASSLGRIRRDVEAFTRLYGPKEAPQA